MSATAAKQVPPPGQINLDHLAHFVPHLDVASEALERLGFTLTPYSEQSHRAEPGGPLVPAGTANRCVMLQRGYLEFLTAIGDTPNAAQLRAAMRRHVGVHVVAFGTAAPEADRARLEKAGYSPLPPVALQREIDTERGRETARFTVVRVPPGTMPEGRIQYCRHHTPALLWQERWLLHANAAAALAGVIVHADDPAEAAQRYARYTGLLAGMTGNVWRISTQRGYLLFAAGETLRKRLGVALPDPPAVAGYVLESANIAVTRSCLAQSGAGAQELGARRLLIELPPALGGFALFEPPGSGALDLD